MLDAIRKIFGSKAAENIEPAHELELATAILLIEVARADNDEHPEELEQVCKLLDGHFHLSEAERATLLERANREASEAVSLQGFTRHMMEELSEARRGDIVGMLWEVAYTDGHIDPQEELLVRRIADLLYVRHAEFIRQKLLAEERMASRQR